MSTNTQTLADHPALNNIQPCLLDLVDSAESEILYANKFTGIEPVPMSNELKELLNSDFGDVGPNLLIQLKKKMSGVPGGPWYIDSRDGCIYIHNRNFRDIPVYTYSYMANSGELLEISFKTNYISKKTSGSIESGVTYNKNVNSEVTFSNLDMTTLKGENWVEARQVARNKETKARILDEQSGDSYRRSLYGQKKVDIEEAYKIYQEGGIDLLNEKVNVARVNAYLQAMTVPELQREATSILEQTATHRGITVSQIGDELKEAMKNGNLENYLKVMFGNSSHTFNAADPYHPQGGYPSTFEVYWVDVFNHDLSIDITKHTYVGTGYMPNKGKVKSVEYSKFRTTTGVNIEDQYLSESMILETGHARGLLALRAYQAKYKGRVKLLEVEPLTYTSKVTSYRGTERTDVIYSQRIKVLVESQSNSFTGPTWRILQNLYTRQLGEGKTIKDVEAHVQSLINRNDEVLEKVISCSMTCVGNPFLASSKVLTLGNLGKTWSGKWYIKTCRHVFNQSGYLCQLTLIQNTVKANSTGLSTEVTVTQPWDGESNYQFLANITPEEAMYYVTEASSPEDQVDFILRVISSREGDDAEYANEHGIVRVVSNTTTTGSTPDKSENSARYSIDDKFIEIPEEVRDRYETVARAAVLNNNLTDVMQKIVDENKE